jgi:hypothetical protein
LARKYEMRFRYRPLPEPCVASGLLTMDVGVSATLVRRE